jgi:hypothetical protein
VGENYSLLHQPPLGVSTSGKTRSRIVTMRTTARPRMTTMTTQTMTREKMIVAGS